MVRYKIVVADDNENIRSALAYLLEDDGYAVDIARDGVEALAAVREHRPHLVILDVMMPKMDGFDVCRAIKSDPQLRDTQVIMLTAMGQVAEQERGKQAGADQFIVKPFSPMEILTLVRKHFRK